VITALRKYMPMALFLSSSAAMPDVVFPSRPWSGTLDWLDPRDI
jgi:hypothetical protein